MSLDKFFMSEALEEAKKGWGLTRPNPLVGAVLVKDDKIIARGHHRFYGGPHAEADLFKNLNSAEETTLYCTLEPCCHTQKKTPPCSPLIIQKKVKRIVIGMKDPNPQVSGKGIQQLQEAGIDVAEGILQEACENLNRSFIINMKEQRAYLHLKIALTKNQIMYLPKKKWITGEEARVDVHWMRADCEAILVGGNTFRIDKPQLNVRGIAPAQSPYFKQPKRFLLSNTLNVLGGFNIIKISNWKIFLQELYQKENIGSLFIEAGPQLAKILIEQNLYDRLSVIEAPFEAEGTPLQTKIHLPFLQQMKTYSNGDLLLESNLIG